MCLFCDRPPIYRGEADQRRSPTIYSVSHKLQELFSKGSSVHRGERVASATLPASYNAPLRKLRKNCEVTLQRCNNNTTRVRKHGHALCGAYSNSLVDGRDGLLSDEFNSYVGIHRICPGFGQFETVIASEIETGTVDKIECGIGISIRSVTGIEMKRNETVPGWALRADTKLRFTARSDQHKR
ncbi:hypothetical protein EVAR_4090_1 [Eumeta japonica]|uniref:Uncharacterized protein n=1 Tax=Eumeta variegata TaxID=151549 RepID=A0A4C1T4Y0_EUMVA|nr:hypothetical protein EVAR_4090_1 [Eumeta japonica]